MHCLPWSEQDESEAANLAAWRLCKKCHQNLCCQNGQGSEISTDFKPSIVTFKPCNLRGVSIEHISAGQAWWGWSRRLSSCKADGLGEARKRQCQQGRYPWERDPKLRCMHYVMLPRRNLLQLLSLLNCKAKDLNQPGSDFACQGLRLLVILGS